jgi:hypothetical protein
MLKASQVDRREAWAQDNDLPPLITRWALGNLPQGSQSYSNEDLFQI